MIVADQTCQDIRNCTIKTLQNLTFGSSKVVKSGKAERGKMYDNIRVNVG